MFLNLIISLFSHYSEPKEAVHSFFYLWACVFICISLSPCAHMRLHVKEGVKSTACYTLKD